MREPHDDESGQPGPDAEPRPGEGVAGQGARLGKYRIVGRLGQGGMGVVFEALDTILQRPVAIKVLPRSVSGDPEILQRFLVEARAAARLSHPNTLSIHDIGEERGYHYLAMELVRGHSAQELLAGGPLRWQEALRIITAACRGLVAAHAARILHRDLKPANILCGLDGSIKLADFGLAKVIDHQGLSITTANRILGTPAFMSPEQCRGEKVDDLSDVYSLGATFHTLLVGQPPYEGNSAMAVMYAHCSRPVPDARTAHPSIPEACARIARRALAKEPMDRFPSAAAMLVDLERALSISTPAAIPPVRSAPATIQSASAATTGTVATLRRPNRHARRWVLVGITAALVSLTVLGGWWLLSSGTPDSGAILQPQEDWRPLFNGKDLTGWKDLKGGPPHWWVQDGVLLGRGDNTYLVTLRDDFQDFRLRLEVQLEAGGNSGVFFRCDDNPGLPSGYEAQIGAQLGSLHRLGLGGSSGPPRNIQTAPEPGRWYRLEVTAHGPRIDIHVDGKQTVTFVEEHKAPQRGRLGLQSFVAGPLVRFRRLEILELPR